jgi:hypothetical protein
VFVLPLCVLAGISAAQKPSDWRPSAVKPADFAKKVDTALLNLKNALGQASYRCRFFDGSIGQSDLTNRIRDRKTLRVEFIKVANNNKDPFSNQTIIGKNGKYTLLSPATGFKPLAAGADPKLFDSSAGALQYWPWHFQQAMFQSFVTGQGAISRLVAALTKPSSGYKIRMDSRTMQGNGKSIPQVRIFASRIPTLAKKKGTETIEIVADTIMWLPLQVRVDQKDLKGRNAWFEWVTLWKGPVKFEERWFTTPKK